MVYRQTARSEKVRSASRKRILTAARRLFDKKGFPGTSMRDIADKAGTSIGNLYFYFRNKEELLGEIFTDALAPVWMRIDDASGSAPAGPARLAIATYANVIQLLVPNRKATEIFLRSGTPQFLQTHVAQEHLTRWRAYLTTNMPGYPAESVELALSVWIGGLRRLLERSIQNELGNTTPLEIAEFAARWNLRAIGVTAPEIESAIAAATIAMQNFLKDSKKAAAG